jgi:Zn-dependent peptidase ImmA (M78 family)
MHHNAPSGPIGAIGAFIDNFRYDSREWQPQHKKKDKIPFNADVLRWARQWRGRTVDEVANKLNQPVQRIRDWEDGKSGVVPTVVQARRLADFYERPFLEFLRRSLPPVKEPDLVPDFRRPRDARTLNAGQERDLKSVLAWAAAQRDNAIDLYDEIGEQPPGIPDKLYASEMDDANLAGERARRSLNFDILEQTSLKSSQRYLLPSIIRRKFEAAGILTFRRNDLNALSVRGICIYASPLPIVIFGSESTGAQAFTLAHELAHVALKRSGIIGPVREESPKTEVWCTQFAAAFLMPRAMVNAIVGRVPRPPEDEISDGDLSTYANAFSLSRHATLIRLVHLGYVKAEFYWTNTVSTSE